MKISPGDLFRVIHNNETFIVLGLAERRMALETEEYFIWKCLDSFGKVRERAVAIGMNGLYEKI